MDTAHPLGIAVCQVIVDGDNADALAFQRVQISGECTDERLAFACPHFRDTALMKDHTAEQLHMEMLHAEHASCCLSDDRVGLRKEIVERLALRETLLEFRSLGLQLIVTQSYHLVAVGLYLLYNRLDPLQLVIAVRAENFRKYAHENSPNCSFPD